MLGDLQEAHRSAQPLAASEPGILEPADVRVPHRLRRAPPSAGDPAHSQCFASLPLTGVQGPGPPGLGVPGSGGSGSRAGKALASHRPPDVSRGFSCSRSSVRPGCSRRHLYRMPQAAPGAPPLLPRAEPARSHPLRWPTPRWTDTSQIQRGRREPRAQETRPGPQHPLCSQPRHPTRSWAFGLSRCLLPTINLLWLRRLWGSRDGGRLLAGMTRTGRQHRLCVTPLPLLCCPPS